MDKLKRQVLDLYHVDGCKTFQISKLLNIDISIVLSTLESDMTGGMSREEYFSMCDRDSE